MKIASGSVRESSGLPLDFVERWCKEHRNKVVRRRNGEMKYIVLGLALQGTVVIRLQRMDDASYTWAPVADINKFVLAYETKGDVMDSNDERLGADELARCYTLDRLNEALAIREEMDLKIAENLDREHKAKLRKEELRETAIRTLEKAAKGGDVRAAEMLLSLQ